MFFDDKTVKRVISCYPKSEKAGIKLVESIIQSHIKKLKADLKAAPNTEEYCKACTKKIINLWNSAARTLEKEGYPLLKIDGLKAVLKHVLPEEFQHFAD